MKQAILNTISFPYLRSKPVRVQVKSQPADVVVSETKEKPQVRQQHMNPFNIWASPTFFFDPHNRD